MGIYIIGLDLGPVLGSLMSGFIVQSLGWRWHLWVLCLFQNSNLQVCSIVAGINLIAIFLFVPETQYDRKYDIDQVSENQNDQNTTENEKSVAPASVEAVIPKKSFLQELKFWPQSNPNASYIHLLVRPWPLIVYPAVFFAFLAFSTTLAWVVCYVDTAASVYQAPPYLMNIGVSGLYNVPAIIGILIGAYVGGALTDFVAERLARRNNGVFEPESRLVPLIIPFFLEPIGLVMYISFSFIGLY